MVLAESDDRTQLLRQAVRQIVNDHCSLQQRIAIETTGNTLALWSKLAEQGWTSLLVPESLGGAGASLVDAGVVWEELGRGLVPGPHISTSVLAAGILAHSDAGDRRSELNRICDGSLTVAVAVTERDYDWSPSSTQLELSRTSHGTVLKGAKHYVPDVDVASHIICLARDSQTGGLALVLLPRDRLGLRVEVHTGWNGSQLSTISFDSCEVQASEIVGSIGEGWTILEPALERATAILCAYMVGAMERVWETSFRYAHQRRQFGQQIARFQRVQDHLVTIRNWTDRARVSTERALRDMENGEQEAPRSTSLAKYSASIGLVESCEASHHLHAGIGSDTAYGLYLYTKAGRTYYHYLGAPAFHEERIAVALTL